MDYIEAYKTRIGLKFLTTRVVHVLLNHDVQTVEGARKLLNDFYSGVKIAGLGRKGASILSAALPRYSGEVFTLVDAYEFTPPIVFHW